MSDLTEQVAKVLNQRRQMPKPRQPDEGEPEFDDKDKDKEPEK